MKLIVSSVFELNLFRDPKLSALISFASTRLKPVSLSWLNWSYIGPIPSPARSLNKAIVLLSYFIVREFDK